MLPRFSSSHSVLPPPHIWTIGRTRFLCAEGVFEGGAAPAVWISFLQLFCWALIFPKLAHGCVFSSTCLLSQSVSPNRGGQWDIYYFHLRMQVRMLCTSWTLLRICMHRNGLWSWTCLQYALADVLEYCRTWNREAPAKFTIDLLSTNPPRLGRGLKKSWHKPLYSAGKKKVYHLSRILNNHRNHAGKIFSLSIRLSLEKFSAKHKRN